MKNISISILVLLFVCAFTTSKAQSDQSFIGQATGAAHDCLQPYEGGLFQISSSVETTTACENGGSEHLVTFAAGPRCNGNGPCPLFPTRIVATVLFDCDGNIIAVTCY